MTAIENPTEFLKVKSGDSVLIGKDEIAKVLTFIGDSSDPDAPTLFQAANVEIGEVHWVQAGDVKSIVLARNS
tara:strand:- start:537 stop:755 length:219 start_codon:yes stop_codon:yes gene_type:complete